jgi:predicted transcriptional regulator of viral defense system
MDLGLRSKTRARDARIDWVKVLQERARYSDVLNAEELATELDFSPSSLRKALTRQQQRGLVERVTHKIYINQLAIDHSPHDFVNILRPNSYVSLESALRLWGISTQTPSAVTCVTTGKPREYGSRNFRIVYRSIAEKLFWGFAERQTRYSRYRLADPEKALLDSIYLSLQEGSTPSIDEFDFKPISRSKLLRYATKFPASVLNYLLPVLASEPFAA